MVTTLLLAALAVVSLSFALLIVPILLLQRFVPRDSAWDEVEESWIRRYGDREPPFIDPEAVSRLRSIPL